MSDAASDALNEEIKERRQEELRNRRNLASIFITAVLRFLEDPSLGNRVSAVRNARTVGREWHEMHKMLTALKQRKRQVWVEFILTFKDSPMYSEIKKASPFNNKHLATVSIDESGLESIDLKVLEDAIMLHVDNLQRIGQKPKGEYLVTLRINKREGIEVFRLKNKK